MKTKHIIIGLIILVVVLFFIQKKEHAAGSVPASPTLSNEAIQNIAKIYADTNNTATFNNIRVTGNVTGNVASPDGAYKLSMQNDGNLVIYKDNKPVWASYSTILQDKAYGIQSQKTGYLGDFGHRETPGWTAKKPPTRGYWENMYFRKVPFETYTDVQDRSEIAQY